MVFVLIWLQHCISKLWRKCRVWTSQTQAGSDTHQRRAKLHHNAETLSSAADTGIPATQSHVSHLSKTIRPVKAWAGGHWHIREAAKTPCYKTLQSVGRKPEEHPGNVRRSTGKACKPWWSTLSYINPVAMLLRFPLTWFYLRYEL